MSSSNDFIKFIQDQLSSWSHVNPKKMFGVIGLYREGIMFGIIADDVVYLKVDHTNKNKYLETGSKPLIVFKSKTEVPSYYELPVEILENAEKFIDWAKESYAIQTNKNK